MKLAAIVMLSVGVALGALPGASVRADAPEELRPSVLVRYAMVLVDRSRPSGEALDLREMAETLPYSLLAPAIDGACVEYSAFPVIGLMVEDEARMELPSLQEQRDALAAALGIEGSYEEIGLRISVEQSARAKSVALATALVLEGGPQGESRESARDGREFFRVKAESPIPGTSLFVIPAAGQRQWVIAAQSRWVRESGRPAEGDVPVPRR